MMKKMKWIGVIAVWMCTVMLFAACGNESNAGGEKDYKVAVKDVYGNIYEGVVVRFMQDGNQVAMQTCDANGVATKTLEAADYTVELQFTDSDTAYYYDKTDLSLTADKTELSITLARGISDKIEPMMLWTVDTESEAYNVYAGSTYLELKEGQRNYYMFAPTEAGTYEFSVLEGENVTIGYYGAPHFVQENSIVEIKDNKFTESIRKNMIGEGETGTTVMVLGLDAPEGTGECVLGIERIGDPEYSLEDEPWTVYQATSVVSKYTLPAGTNLLDFNLEAATGEYNLVYNEGDGYYHLNAADGPVVYMRLGQASRYVDCFKAMIENIAMTRYFFDDEEKFIKKEIYDDCLRSYFTGIDEKTGVYPLTKDLEYIVKSYGGGQGWFDPEHPGYIFDDANGNPIRTINPEISWLLMCCYAE